ncbi:MAG: hypothetical protein ACLQLH_03600 [Terracidiphilus sp.]
MPKKSFAARTQISSVSAIPSTPPLTLTFDASYKGITGGVAAAVLFAFFEKCFSDSPAGTNLLHAPISKWMLQGNMGRFEFARAFRQFGYRYWSKLEFEAARSAGRAFIHPVSGTFLLYALIRDWSTGHDLLLRNSTLIEARIRKAQGDTLSSPSVLSTSLDGAGRSDARRLLKRIGGL